MWRHISPFERGAKERDSALLTSLIYLYISPERAVKEPKPPGFAFSWRNPRFVSWRPEKKVLRYRQLVTANFNKYFCYTLNRTNAAAVNYLKESMGCECRRSFRNNLKYARVRKRKIFHLSYWLDIARLKRKENKKGVNKNTHQNSSTICPCENCRKIEKALRNHQFILTDRFYTVTVVAQSLYFLVYQYA